MRLEERQAMRAVKVGDGEVCPFPLHPRWTNVPAIDVPLRQRAGRSLGTRVRVAWSETGLYFHLEADDTELTVTLERDFSELWTEDVLEIFLWPDETIPAYFEYEISPLGYELPLMVINNGGRFRGWAPWQYEGERRVRKSVTVLTAAGPAPGQPGQKKIEGWAAEVFVPWAMFEPLIERPPRAGDRWRANFYRLDYDTGEREIWAWQPIEKNFHEPERFGDLEFC